MFIKGFKVLVSFQKTSERTVTKTHALERSGGRGKSKEGKGRENEWILHVLNY